MSFQLKFEQKGDFQAWRACQAWLNDRGYSYGHCPIDNWDDE